MNEKIIEAWRARDREEFGNEHDTYSCNHSQLEIDESSKSWLDETGVWDYA